MCYCRVWAVGAAMLSVGAVGVLALGAGRLRVNLSPSVPVGLYVAEPLSSSRHVHRGELVEVCLGPEIDVFGRSRGYLHRGRCADRTAPVGKPVFATGGDTIDVDLRGLTLNGRLTPGSRQLAIDGSGRPLPRIAAGRYVVSPGEIWLVSTYSERSWDSRYFGPVAETATLADLRPIWSVGSP